MIGIKHKFSVCLDAEDQLILEELEAGTKLKRPDIVRQALRLYRKTFIHDDVCTILPGQRVYEDMSKTKSANDLCSSCGLTRRSHIGEEQIVFSSETMCPGFKEKKDND